MDFALYHYCVLCSTDCASVLCLICALLNYAILHYSYKSTDARFEVSFLVVIVEIALSSIALCVSYTVFFRVPAEYLQRGWPVCVGRRAQVELHRDDGGPSENVMRKVAS